jgi:hypothetical protein
MGECLYYNEKLDELRSDPPGGNWNHKEEFEILYPDYKKVPLDFVKPIKEKSKEIKLAELDADYKETFNSLAYAMSIAQLNADTTKIDSLRSTYNSKRQSYAQERSAIKNG